MLDSSDLLFILQPRNATPNLTTVYEPGHCLFSSAGQARSKPLKKTASIKKHFRQRMQSKNLFPQDKQFWQGITV
jgi:hypothetical protein